MKAGRFLKLYKGRKLLARMNQTWDAGGIVTMATYTRAVHIKPNARELIWMGKSGSLYIKRGKSNDCIDYCAFRFTA
jgi:hypothetical protein